MKKLALTMTVTMGGGVDPLDLYPQLKADILAAPLVKIVEGEASETHVTQMSASQFIGDQGGGVSFVLNCAVENAFDFSASFDILRGTIANGLGVSVGDVSIASAEESDLPD
jgi:hypothetical protein